MVTLREMIDLIEAMVSLSTIESFVHETKRKFGLNSFEMILTKRLKDLEITSFNVSEENQNQGKGTRAMKAICAFADKHNLRITLTPATKKDPNGKETTSRLSRFYKKFGFVENRDKHRDALVKSTMLRNPK